MRVVGMLGAVLLAGGLGGCVPPPQQQALVYAAPPSAPLVAVPGPGKAEAAFRADDGACQADVARLPPGRAGQPSAAQLRAAQVAAQTAGQAAGVAPELMPLPPEELPPGAAYLRCMTSRGNQVQALQAAAPPAYGYLAAYPVYAGIGFGYPFFYDDPFLLRFYGGFGYRGYGYYRGFGSRGYGYGYGRGYGGYGYGRGYGGHGYGGGRYAGYGYGGRFGGGGFGRGEGGGYRGGFGQGGFGRR